jgi:Ca-activated chloride channel homolog
MNRSIMVLVLAVAVFLGSASPVLGDGLIIPQPRPHEPPPPLRSLAIRYHRVTVTIDNQVATTRVDQVFLNDSANDIEGEYFFPLPDGASISSFSMWVDGQRLEAEILEHDKARQIYEDIVRQQRDPALLEYAGRNAFRARIYPIPAHGEKRIEIEYSEILSQDQGLVRYVYPLNTEKFSSRPLEEASITVRIASRQPLKAVYSPSHEVTIRRDGDKVADVRYKEQQVTPDKDFVLYYTLSTSDLGANLLSYRQGKEDGFFVLLLAPRTEVESSALVAQDVFLVLDTSGSMRGEKLEQTKRAAAYVLNALNAQDRFNIIAFNTNTRLFAQGLQPASAVPDALDFVARLAATGGTDIGAAFAETLGQIGKQRPQVVVFLTDGQPTIGEINGDRIVSAIAQQAGEQVRIFSFGVGYDVNTTLLDSIAQAHHGTSAYVRPEEDIEQVVSSFYEKISRPVLADLSLDFGALQVEDTYPNPLPDLFAGGQLVLVGRYRQGTTPPATTTVTLRGSVGGKSTSFSFTDVHLRTADGGEDFIPRLWATRKIGYLLTQVRLHGAERELVDEIVDLSVRYGIITPYTSFLVNETEDALTSSGRRDLGAQIAATPSPGRSLGAAAAPASGAEAVKASEAQKSLRQADVAAAPPSERVRTVGERAFVLRDEVWMDTLYDPTRMQAEDVLFGSERYFQLLRDHAEWGRYLALGTEVILVWQGQAYHFGAQGASSPLPTPEVQPTLSPCPDQSLWRYLPGNWNGQGCQ